MSNREAQASIVARASFALLEQTFHLQFLTLSKDLAFSAIARVRNELNAAISQNASRDAKASQELAACLVATTLTVMLVSGGRYRHLN